MKTQFETTYFEHLIRMATWAVNGTTWVWIPELTDVETNEEELIQQLWAL